MLVPGMSVKVWSVQMACCLRINDKFFFRFHGYNDDVISLMILNHIDPRLHHEIFIDLEYSDDLDTCDIWDALKKFAKTEPRLNP